MRVTCFYRQWVQLGTFTTWCGSIIDWIWIKAVSFWHWSQHWQWYGILFGAYVAFVTLQEFAFGVVVLFLSAFGLFSKLMHWKGIAGSRFWTVLLKSFGSLVILGLFVMFTIITNGIQGDAASSHLETPAIHFVDSRWPIMPPRPLRTTSPPPQAMAYDHTPKSVLAALQRDLAAKQRETAVQPQPPGDNPNSTNIREYQTASCDFIPRNYDRSLSARLAASAGRTITSRICN
jgi:hypothetical protein